MKHGKSILAFFLLLLSLNTLQAQDKRTPEEKAKKRTELMTPELSLTAEQVAKVQTLNLDDAKKMDKIRTKDIDRKEKGVAMRKQRTVYEASLKPILTETQWKTYVELRDKRQQERMEKRDKAPDGQ